MDAKRSSDLSDPARLAQLRALGIEDPLPDESFDRLAGLASRILSAPVSFVCVVLSDRQFFSGCAAPSGRWTGCREMPLSYSFCQHAVRSGEPLVVEDVREHPLVRENSAVRELGVVAYAGVPLISSAGFTLGTFCAVDTVPRAWTAAEVETLRELAAFVTTELELRAEVAARRRVESALTMSDSRVQSLLQHSSDFISVLDASGSVRYRSASVTRMLGYEPEELGGRRMFELMHEEDLPEVLATLDRVRKSPDEAGDVQVRVRHKDGTWRWLEARMTNHLRDRAVGGIIVNTRDVTVRREAAQQLRESEERFRGLFEEAAVGIVVGTLEGRITAINPALERMLGYTPDELYDRSPLDFTHPDDAQRYLLLFQQVMAGEREHYSIEKRYIRKDGSLLYGRLTLSVFREIEGRPRSVIAMLEDIGDRVRAEALEEEVRILRGMLPICLYCKRIRNEVEAWESLEEYISSRSHAEFTHGICPGCEEHPHSLFLC